MTDWRDMDWRSALTALDAAADPHVLVTVIEALGSTPREAGAKMIVTADAFSGSIGGGELEQEAMDAARRLLAEGASAPVTEKLMLGADRNQCCGGAATLLFEPFAAPTITVALFGAGHVATALVRVLEGTPVRILWIDERPDAFPPSSRAFTRRADDPATEVAGLPAGARAYVMTHSHDRDYEILAALLKRDDLGPVGLIGSKTKWARFRKRLLEDGVAPQRVDAVACPIGLPGVGGKRPAEIAIAVAAEILANSPDGETL
ncbi:XdhC protein (assists in molybdopterin insertion into xanthine dehydrogenase) [Caenispirillum salinarum AK4]|uniref:XdhC protein (Assists in molybdopterin insertion into xanthine dehydrogenase) n=1 Tax=Caenispirillum salinarum AK4 TaxID=1238182 RepID=K9GVE9_9PROT|nr:xanthine dehydrogenase accessory protein XdhC [Caenispirillum salinarum]EKV28674.1 XdhC protein (assists in molybdopterin insertion into xanthine dehydrogenase) [Caenispirillum salinarum AK4]